MNVPKRVLFIDDELELWEDNLREELAAFDFEIKGEADPRNTLKIISEYNPDVILLDILFPEGNLGKPTLEKIKDKYPYLPVVMITSTMDKEDYNAAEYAQADFRYAKLALADGDYSDLAATLENAIEKYKNLSASREKLKSADSGMDRYGFIVGTSPQMKEISETIDKVATGDLSVLITGESGTGKELLAKAIHRLSNRKDKPFIPVVCAAMPKDLLESELFGHEKGSFTGAVAQKKGKFELAEEGTIFLDEISEVPLETQVKLLRFLQEKTFERVGGQQILNSKSRIIAATNKNLEKEITNGAFREDLFYRLNVIAIHLPPLRERKEDIPILFKSFIEKANMLSGKKLLSVLRDDVKSLLYKYTWPGNIREIENAILRAVALAEENILQPNNFSTVIVKEKGNLSSLLDVAAIVDQIMNGKMTWNDLKSAYGVKSPIRREVLIALQKRWEHDYKRGPSAKEMSELLKTSYNNMRRILSELKIKNQ